METSKTRMDGTRFVRVAQRVTALGATDAERARKLGVSRRTVLDLRKGILPYFLTHMAKIGLAEDYAQDARDLFRQADDLDTQAHSTARDN
jgi:transcriptional regulator with XRE-family HTH domain